MIELMVQAKAEFEGGARFHEKVAVGFLHGEVESWYALPNQAVAVGDPGSDGRGEFFVDGHDLGHAFQMHAEEHAGLAVDGADGSHGVARCDLIVLWHTHHNTVEPSPEDIAEFRGDIFDVGIVWHVPSGTTTLYSSDGILDPATHSFQSGQADTPLATCPTAGCAGDIRYGAPGRGHIHECTYPRNV